MQQKKFNKNSSISIKGYLLDKNEKLINGDSFIILTEKEIHLLEILLNKRNQFLKQIFYPLFGTILQTDTHTVETHIYRLRKKSTKCLVMRNRYLITKMVITYEKRNKFAVDLITKKYRKRIVKPKKGKGSFKRKKKYSF